MTLSTDADSRPAQNFSELAWLTAPMPVRRAPLRQWIAGPIIFAVILPLLLLSTVGYFGFDREGRGLVVDTALWFGLGQPIPEATFTPGECRHYHSYGRFGGSGDDCEINVTYPGRNGGDIQTVLSVDLGDGADVTRFEGAGVVLGAVGLYWPGSIIADRWRQSALIFICIAVLAGILWVPLHMLRADLALARAGRRGEIRPVDLLYRRSNRWTFAYLDAQGRRRFARSVKAGPALALDGLLTRGAALCYGRHVWLLLNDLDPLSLPAAESAKLKAQALEFFQLPRAALAPRDSEPREPAARLQTIAGFVGKAACKRDVAAGYVLAWRLVYDGSDAEIAPKAFEFRNDAGRRLGPAVTFRLLQECRGHPLVS